MDNDEKDKTRRAEEREGMAEGETASETSERLARKRSRQRKVIISALAAGGVFQLNGWQVQAHGNRSTLSASPVFRPIDPGPLFVRPIFTAPSLQLFAQLDQVSEELRSLDRTHPTLVGSPEHRKLVDIKASLAKKVDHQPSAGEAFKLLPAGDTVAAVASIEGLATPEGVVGEYYWTLMDVAYLGRERETMSQFTSLAKPAMDYAQKTLASTPADAPANRELRTQVAQLYHHIASFTVPDDGAANANDLKLGRESAERALKLRQEMGSQHDVMVAEWMAGNHARRAADSKAAEQHLRAAAELAVALDDKAAQAWSYSYLAKALSGSKPSEAKSFEQRALLTAEAAAGKDATVDFLRIRMKLAMK